MKTTEITPLSRDRRAKFAAFAGALAAFSAAQRDDSFAPLLLGIFALASAWSVVFEVRFRKLFLPPPLKIGLIVAGSAAFVMFGMESTRGGVKPLADAIARYLFWNATVLVLSRDKSDHDLWTLAVIELSLFMAAGAFVQPPDFVPLLLISLACFLYSSQRAQILRCGPAGETEKRGLALAALTFLFVIEAGAVVFFAFPRQAFRENRAREGARNPGPGAGSAGWTGIPTQTEFLTLISFERLKNDSRAVLRVRITDSQDQLIPADQTLYLRGAILDTYENGRWKAKFRKEERRVAGDGWTRLEDSPPPGRMTARQHIRTVPLAGDLSFCLPDPVRVRWREARYDPAGILFFPFPPLSTVEYVVESALAPMEIPRSPAPFAAPERWLQLPPGLEKLRELARKQTEGLEDRIHAKATRLVLYLMRNGFRYRLGPFVPSGGEDPVEHFLEKREGSCVHYATALALLCRAAGVPARIATGFQLHDPLEDGSFLVRNSDAHAWVEVWFGPGHGWRAYDATPAEVRPTGAPAEGDPVATLDPKKPGEAPPGMPGRRMRSLVDLDPGLQGRAARAVLGALAAAGRFLVSPVVPAALAVLAALACGVWFLLPPSRKNRHRQMASGFREPASIDFYRDFLWALSRRGLRKPPALTAREFAIEARRRINDPGIDFVTVKFCEACYRGTPPTPQERLRIDEVIDRVGNQRV